MSVEPTSTLPEIGKEDADAAVLVLVIDHVIAECVAQIHIVDDEMPIPLCAISGVEG